jgi:hypothetical protein
VSSSPDYLNRFEYKKDPELGNKYIAVKRGKYNLELEEIELNKIIKEI